MSLLESIQNPHDLRKLPPEALPGLAEEIRKFMIEKVSATGGHLASSLGTVELTLALHYYYNTPTDSLVWDVGHQAYTHKILTGRRDRFETLRQAEGMSGFPRISESPYDTISVGHASTSISAALGLAVGRDLKKESSEVVAIIGDGSLSGGLAFEGLNNVGALSTKMTVILNDNRMSISNNVGALSRYLTRLRTDKRFNKIRSEIWEMTGNLPKVGSTIRTLIHSLDDALKHAVIPGKLFEDFGLRYFGPVDGHSIKEMVEMFKFVKESTTGPVLVHVLTCKGKGYSFAENDSTKFHGVGCFTPSTGAVNKQPTTNASYSDIFGTALVELATDKKEVVAITAAMPDGTGLKGFREKFPERLFDVGIAESHAVTFAAGLARSGMRPVVALYSTFLQRAYDQIVHDVALDNLPVTFCIDRAGLVGEDGPTHHGAFDISYLRGIPSMVLMAPRSGAELRDMLYAAMAYDKGPVAIRYPRGCAGLPLADQTPPQPIQLFMPETLCTGEKVAVVILGDPGFGYEMLVQKLHGKQITPTIINARFAKPIDVGFYRALAAVHTHIVTIESGTVAGGFGSGVMEVVSGSRQLPQSQFLTIGYPDEFIAHGAIPILLDSIGFTLDKIADQIFDFVKP